MKLKRAIKEKLVEAQKEFETSSKEDRQRLAIVVLTLRWVLDTKLIYEPKDPIGGE